METILIVLLILVLAAACVAAIVLNIACLTFGVAPIQVIRAAYQSLTNKE